jgi:hypothetical protein
VRLIDALREYDAATRESARVNKLKKDADAAKNKAKAIVVAKLEEEELDGAPATIDGTKVRFSKYELPWAVLQDREEFAAWAAENDPESYFEAEARVRQDLLNALVRQRLDDGEPLPPGLGVSLETKLSRRAE